MKDLTNGLFKFPSKEQRKVERAGAPLNPFKLSEWQAAACVECGGRRRRDGGPESTHAAMAYVHWH